MNTPIYVCVPTTEERRPRLAKLIESVRKSDYPNITMVIHEGKHPGCVEAVHTMLEGINGVVFMLSDDNEIYPDTISKLYEAFIKAFPKMDGLVQPLDPIQNGQLPVTPMCHSNLVKKYFYKGYVHNFSDNEFKEILESLGKYVIVPDVKVEHWHVSRDPSLQDETYATNQRTYTQDENYTPIEKPAALNQKMSSKPKILIGLPTMSSVHTFLMVDILSWMAQAMNEKQYNLSVYPTMSVQPVDNARNEIVDEFLKSDCTHLFFVDSDTIPPQDALKKLIALDKPIATGLTPIIENDEKKANNGANGFYKRWNCVGMDEKILEPHMGVVPIKGAGSSCILIKREVFEKLEKPYYRFLYQDQNGKECFVGEDIQFIVRALGAGIQAYADTSIVCKHYKPIIW